MSASDTHRIRWPTFVQTLVMCVISIQGQRPPELSGDRLCANDNVIGLPTKDRCLVPVKTAANFAVAHKNCEMAGGTLYQPPSLILDSNERLMRCMASMEDSTFNDVWFNGIGNWFQHFYWRDNGTILNPVTYCSDKRPLKMTSSLESNSLSVDYCVSTCHDQAYGYVIVHHTQANAKCYCTNKENMKDEYKEPCDVNYVKLSDRSKFYIIHAKENSLIRMSNTNTFTSSEILCATVDGSTFTSREMNSDTCFSRLPFICNLGSAADCPRENCQGEMCLFPHRNKYCLKRVNYAYTWFEARTYCQDRGGDLWVMEHLQEVKNVAKYLAKEMRYWIGGTNYFWRFNVSSQDLGSVQTNSKKVRCGHMSHQHNTRWQWSDTDCDQPKSYLCQFNNLTLMGGQNRFQDQEDNVFCPWPIPEIPTFTPPVPVVVGPLRDDDDDDGFPLAALIAGLIAGLILLTCLAVALTFCWRKQYVAGKQRQTKDRLAFVPYFSDSNQIADFESMSNAGHMRSNMSFVSENGSQVGLIKGGYQGAGITSKAMSSSYNEQTLDHKQKDSMDRKLADIQNFLVSNNSSMDERGFVSANNTMGTNKPKDLMTLQAEMNIQDDTEAMRGSLRGKPEVTLVTDNVDMNFTVNHATPHGDLGNERSRSSLERTLEEIALPASAQSEGMMTVTIPEGATEVTLMGTVAQGSNGLMTATFPERVMEAQIVSSMNGQVH